jgi:dipeptidyl aminopeptidase/acylaminoacyl peptidase
VPRRRSSAATALERRSSPEDEMNETQRSPLAWSAWPAARVFLSACVLAVPAAADIRPNENLVVDGIPAIPDSVAEAVGRYTEFRTAAAQGWHPLRRELLITTRFADTAQVHVVKTPGGDRRQLTFFPDRVSDASYQPTKGDFFIFVKDTGGNEFRQLYRYDLPGGAVTLLTDGKSQNGELVWSTAGDRIVYGSTRRNGKDRDLYVQDPRDPKSDRRLAELEGGGWRALDWSPDDAKILALEEISANETYLWIVDAATGTKSLLTPKGGPEKVAYGGGQFAADGRSVYVTTDRDSEFQRLARIDLATGKHTYLTSHIDWDVDSFDLSRDGKTLAFVTNEDGADRLRLLDTGTEQEKPVTLPGLGAGLIEGLDWHPDNHDLAFTFSSARSPADAYSLDTATGKVERWTESETGGLDPAGFAEPELVHWKSFDGRTISGFLYRPPGRFTGRRPVVVNIHGGPEGQARPGFLMRTNYYLNELGVAVIYPNARGSTGYGKTFLKLDNGLLREDSVKDIGALFDWIGARPDLDAGRVMVTGGSYGGYMTLGVAMHYADRIRCALDVVGISNFITFMERTEAYRRDLRRVEYGDERDPKMREFFNRIAAVNNVDKFTKPLFIVAGQNDPRVPVREGEQMVAAMKKNGKPVWWLMARDEGHGFAKKKNQDFQFYATVGFMQQYLLN